jgi:hypothetical protein
MTWGSIDIRNSKTYYKVLKNKVISHIFVRNIQLFVPLEKPGGKFSKILP